MEVAARFFAHHPRRLFLIDGLGALLTAFLLVGLVANLEDSFGMPRKQLYFLASIAVLFAVYSFSCSLFLRETWHPFLKAIAVANLAYCCLTIGLVFFFSHSVTLLGMGYFAGETIVVGVLVLIELRTMAFGLHKKAARL